MEINNLENDDQTVVAEGKTIAIVAYLTIIGLIVAFVLNNEKKNSFASFHIRQSLGVMLTGLALGVVAMIPFLGWIVALFGWIFILILWVSGFLAALNGKRKPVMILGEKYQEWLGGI